MLLGRLVVGTAARLIEWGQRLLDFWAEQPGRALLGALGLILCVAGFLVFVWAWRPVMTKRQSGGAGPSTGVGSVSVGGDLTINAPAQVGGQGNTLNVNQPAHFAGYQVEPYQDGSSHHMRVRFMPSPGRTFQPGTPVKFVIKLARACRKWTVDPTSEAFGDPRLGEETGPEENTNTIVWGIGYPPRPGVAVLFDIEDSQPIEVVGAGWKPRAAAQ